MYTNGYLNHILDLGRWASSYMNPEIHLDENADIEMDEAVPFGDDLDPSDMNVAVFLRNVKIVDGELFINGERASVL